MDQQPPTGVGVDLSQVVARDADLEEGASWQDLVPSNCEAAAL